ncbi:MAG: hypothetical protein HYY18_15845 [Planctomycetes bacterium]|nr:hypothetical protein [Planctomycetota bacterium]
MDMKKNGFWIALAAGVGVALIGFVALVLPLWSEEASLKASVTGSHSASLTQIKGGGDSVPTDQWVSELAANDAAVVGETKKLYRFFAQGDQGLEAWFDGAKEPPPKGVMMSKASDGIAKMMKELREKMGDKQVPLDGKNFSGDLALAGFEFVRSEDVPEGDIEARKRWMRVYNIHVRMKEAMIEADAKKFYKVQFSAVQDTVLNTRLKDPGITNDLGNYIPFIFQCGVLWKDVPTLLASILRWDEKKPGPMFRVSLMRVERDTHPAYLKSSIEVDVPEEEYDPATWKAGPEMMPDEDPMKVTLVIHAYNFNFPEEKLK